MLYTIQLKFCLTVGAQSVAPKEECPHRAQSHLRGSMNNYGPGRWIQVAPNSCSNVAAVSLGFHSYRTKEVTVSEYMS